MKKSTHLQFIGKYAGVTSAVMFAFQIARRDMVFTFVWMCIGAVSFGFVLGGICSQERSESAGWWCASMISLLLSLCLAVGPFFAVKDAGVVYGMWMILCAMGSVSFAECAMISPVKNGDAAAKNLSWQLNPNTSKKKLKNRKSNFPVD